MAENQMKSETREEAAERLRSLSEAERAGSEAAKEGILAIQDDPVLRARADQLNDHGVELMRLQDSLGDIDYSEEGGEAAANAGSSDDETTTRRRKRKSEEF